MTSLDLARQGQILGIIAMRLCRPATKCPEATRQEKASSALPIATVVTKDRRRAN